MNEERKREGDWNKCESPPPFTSELRASGLGNTDRRWKRFVEMPWNWISRQGLFCQGFAIGVIG